MLKVLRIRFTLAPMVSQISDWPPPRQPRRHRPTRSPPLLPPASGSTGAPTRQRAGSHAHSRPPPSAQGRRASRGAQHELPDAPLAALACRAVGEQHRVVRIVQDGVARDGPAVRRRLGHQAATVGPEGLEDGGEAAEVVAGGRRPRPTRPGGCRQGGGPRGCAARSPRKHSTRASGIGAHGPAAAASPCSQTSS